MAKRVKKKKQNGLRRAGRVLYSTVLVLSVLIVGGFAAFKILAPPPVQAMPPMASGNMRPPPSDDPETPEDESSNTPEPITRKEGFYTFLLAASDQASGNADTIMVVSYDTVNQKVGVVSIPRDTLTQKYRKINSAYQEGVEELKDVAADLIGIPIDYYITVNIKAFKALVNAVDGVDFYVPTNMSYDDPTQDLSIHYTEGMHHLNGSQALEVVRFRHNNDGSGYNDTGRTETQQKLLVAVAKKVLSPSNLGNINTFIKIFEENVTTDLSAGDIAYFASKLPGMDLKNNISAVTLPGDGDVTYKGTKWCYQLYPEECLTIFNELLNPYTAPLTKDMTNIVQVK